MNYVKKIFRPIKNYIYGKIPDKVFAKIMFRIRIGYDLNLDNPKSYNEKIQWLKLNDRTPLHTICADKYKVRDFVKDRIGKEYLIPLFLETKKIEDIKPENMPDEPIVIKTNHDSGTVFIIRDKSNANWELIREKIKKALSNNYYGITKEWQYKDIEPRIIVEKLLTDDMGRIPSDVKIFCSDGEPKFMLLCLDRETGVKFVHLTMDFEIMPFFSNGQSFDMNSLNITPPQNLDLMLDLAKRLSKGLKHARVDFFNINGQIYFGEITFHDSSGFMKIDPLDWDYKLGEFVNINHKKRNC
ncbi:ATP-grasp fold amidoligase family protein [Endozoicomonas gorgoniicola]|uniref:ATP-grasp fold amidoligase family protein n=1 Tax=Endozoicomonas gorgoniicola TaxID=1234144 RepID=A0ABT3MV06_9GAMM|nr:ATP-grasp fold amidoligase family protein [Endozoicomonas gorgoniicola]MCW7553203.1 ATP-grasp fold amidoligase family protein [Endozoicomonas gorgoniicola]